MQAVILAAGRGKRMKGLTTNVPKPLLLASGKTLIEYKLDILPPEITEAILVVGYLGDKIKDRIGNVYRGVKISYVWQEEPLGTAHALFQTKDLIKGEFLAMMGDDIYDAGDLRKMTSLQWGILASRAEKSGGRAARILLDKSGSIEDVLEGQEIEKGDLINTGCYALGEEFFDYPIVKLPGRNEYGLPQTLALAAKDRRISIIETGKWFPVTSPEDIKKAEDFLGKTG